MSSPTRTTILIPILAIAALALAGCSEVPQAAIDAAGAKLGEAEAAQADTYAADQLAAARQAMEAVNTEVAAQGEKFALLRSYQKTNELVAAAEQLATAAREAADAGREQAKAAANTALETLRTSTQAASDLHAQLGQCRRPPKGFAADLEQLGGTLTGLNGQVAEVESAIGGGDYLGASALAASLQSQVDDLSAEMSAAKAEIGC